MDPARAIPQTGESFLRLRHVLARGKPPCVLNLEAELNERQLEAALHSSGPLLVLAGAGSGKTRVITFKIAHLVMEENYRPWEILAVTFTNKAAREMRERTQRILGKDAKDVWLGTFHSICLRVLRRHAELVGRSNHFVVYDEDDRERLLKRTIRDLNISNDVLNVRQVKSYIDQQKHLLRGPTHPELPVEGYIQSLCAKVYKGYEAAKKRADAFDFSDLIQRTVVLFESHPPVLSEWRYRWRYIMVDEFQDTDHAQYRLLKMLAGDKGRICVVGDDDQSIYRWRGADVSNILGFHKDFPGLDVHVVRLERNYRSTANILKAASALIRHNKARHDKTLWTDTPAGAPIRCYQAETETGEARWVVRELLKLVRAGECRLAEVAVFYRTHSQSRVFEDALRGQGTPYIVVGGLKFYERKEVKDILAYLRLVQNPRDDVAFARVVNVPTRGVGAKTLKSAAAISTAEDIPLFDALARYARQKGGRIGRAVAGFESMISKLRNVANSEKDTFRVAEAILSQTGYLTRLQEEGTMEAQTRSENVQELMVSIEDWRSRAEDKGLAAFLDHVSLLTSLDEGEEEKNAVTLMTIHAAKGLEFDTVFVTGLEEDVFPHFNSKDDEAIEEERRLAYVAITRGKRRVHLAWARSRRRFGRLDVNPPSRFVSEIPNGIKQLESEIARRPAFGSMRAQAGEGSGSSGGWTAGASSSSWEPASQDPVDELTKRRAPGTRPSWLESEPKAAPRSNGPRENVQDTRAPDPQGGELAAGRQVRHPRFGTGKVRKVDGSGPDARVVVRFPAFGEKRIIARFLELI